MEGKRLNGRRGKQKAPKDRRNVGEHNPIGGGNPRENESGSLGPTKLKKIAGKLIEGKSA